MAMIPDGTLQLCNAAILQHSVDGFTPSFIDMARTSSLLLNGTPWSTSVSNPLFETHEDVQIAPVSLSLLFQHRCS